MSELPVQKRDELDGLALVLAASDARDMTWIHCPNRNTDTPARLLARLDDGIRVMYLCGLCGSTHTVSQAEKFLQEITDRLRSIEWPEGCQDNISAAIVYLDCARQNILDA